MGGGHFPGCAVQMWAWCRMLQSVDTDQDNPVTERAERKAQRPHAYTTMTAERKAVFLQELNEHGIIGWACRQASPHSKGSPTSSFYDERKRDPEFAAEWDAALERSNQAILRELHRRAIDGVDESDKHGNIRTRYSDSLMALMLKSKRFGAEFNERHEMELSGTVANVNLELDALSPESREQLRAILAREQQAQIGDGTPSE